MTLFSILIALVLEQFRPLRRDNVVYGWIIALAGKVEQSFNAGRPEHGRLGWIVMIALLALPTLMIYWLLGVVSVVAQLAWTVLVVYLTLGFRHYSHYFSAIQIALNESNVPEARPIPATWTLTKLSELRWSVR
jgi:adenosylcobinamide-phosphate synthase